MKWMAGDMWRNRFTFLFIILFVCIYVLADERIKVSSLKGYWKINLGDNSNWKLQNYNDTEWDQVYMPSSWEEQGFHGYDGYAWLRKSFSISESFKDMGIIIHLGYIDDVDEVYINGKLIGNTGSFPPKYQTAFNAYRKYNVPREIINFNGKNVISIRIFDAEREGGIVRGDIGIYANPNSIPLDIDLQGVWKFKLYDDLERRHKDYNDENWDDIIVPNWWENQGYKEYDGYAWYRKKFKVGEQFVNKRIVVVIGKVDDLDDVYINGKLINPIPRLKEEGAYIKPHGDAWKTFSAYYISGDILIPNSINTIAIRVFDDYNYGGIYEGPVGIVEQKKFVNYWKNRLNKR